MNTRDVASAAILAAFAIALTLSGLSTFIRMPPPFSYLVFDPAEIPSLIAYMAYGLKVGSLVATLHFLFLMFRGEFVPIGPLMKYTAVLSTLIGLHVAYKLKFKEVTSVIFAAVLRALIMNILNIIILMTIFREFLENLGKTLLEGLVLALIVTAIYNVAHVSLFDYPLAKLVLLRIKIKRKS